MPQNSSRHDTKSSDTATRPSRRQTRKSADPRVERTTEVVPEHRANHLDSPHRGSPLAQQDKDTDWLAPNASDDESETSSFYEADELQVIPHPSGSKSRKRGFPPSLENATEASPTRYAKQHPSAGMDDVQHAFLLCTQLQITTVTCPALLDIVKNVPRARRPEYLNKLDESKFIRTVLESEYVVTRIPCINRNCTVPYQIRRKGSDGRQFDPRLSKSLKYRHLVCAKRGDRKGCGKCYIKDVPEVIRSNRQLLTTAFTHYNDLNYNPYRKVKRTSSNHPQRKSKQTSTIPPEQPESHALQGDTVNLQPLSTLPPEPMFGPESVFFEALNTPPAYHPSQRFAPMPSLPLPESQNTRIPEHINLAPAHGNTTSLDFPPSTSQIVLPSLPLKAKRPSILDEDLRQHSTTHSVSNAREAHSGNSASPSMSSSQNHDIRADLERQAQDMATFKQAQAAQMTELKAMLQQLVTTQTHAFASMTERIKNIEIANANPHYPQLPSPTNTTSLPRALPALQDPNPVTISQEVENEDGNSEWLKVATAAHPPTPASFGIYQQDIVNFNQELEALSTDWSKTAQSRLHPREISVVYIKKLQRSDERLLAQSIATAIRSITNQRPVIFVSFIGDSLAEFLVTKQHRALLIALIRTRHGVLAGDIDPVFGQLRRTAPSHINSSLVQNAAQCLKRAKKCLRYKGVEVSRYYAHLAERAEAVIAQYKAENPNVALALATPASLSNAAQVASKQSDPRGNITATLPNITQNKQAATAAVSKNLDQLPPPEAASNIDKITPQDKQATTPAARKQLLQHLPKDANIDAKMQDDDDAMSDIDVEKPIEDGTGNSTASNPNL